MSLRYLFTFPEKDRATLSSVCLLETLLLGSTGVLRESVAEIPNHRNHRARTKCGPNTHSSGDVTPPSDLTTSALSPKAKSSTGQKGRKETANHKSRLIVNGDDPAPTGNPRQSGTKSKCQSHRSQRLPSPIPIQSPEQFETFLQTTHRYPDLTQFRFGCTYYRRYDKNFGQPVHNSSDPNCFCPSVNSPRNTSTHRFLPGNKQAYEWQKYHNLSYLRDWRIPRSALPPPES